MRRILCLLTVGVMSAFPGCHSPSTNQTGKQPGHLPQQTLSSTEAVEPLEESEILQAGLSLPAIPPAENPPLPAPISEIPGRLAPEVPGVRNLMEGDFGSPSIATQHLTAPGEMLTLESLESLARQHNPTLVQATAQIQANHARAFQAGLYPNPTLKYIAEQIGVEGTAGEFQGGEVSQRIVTAGKLDLSRRKYQARARITEIQAAAQGMRVMNDVRTHFYRTLGAMQLLDLHQELRKHAEDHLVTAQELYNVGQANKVDVHQANVKLQQARLDLKMAENRLAMEQAQLQAIVSGRLPGGTMVTGILESNLPLLEYQPTLAQILSESPELAAAHAKLQADHITLQREEAEPIPDLVFSAASGYNFEANETVYGAGLSLEVPLFDRNQGTIRQAEWDIARQQAEIHRVEQVLTRKLAQVYRHYLSAYQKTQDYQMVVLPETKAAYEKILQSYKENRQEWPEVLKVQHDYIQMRIDYVMALVELREQEVLMQGLLLSDGLMAAEGSTPAGHIDAVPQPR